ncbi:fumarylacetoacetate hydrolase family protein [Vibrio nitrifigilis]|uniref:Fumarylacetoacetate hydrolase family protein n=1 Tax=Vibrio nitrifigilis TaxID=2789781 RepID=A0ABS0GDT4_9VIBR|nr:fumarylacetoacetate hydrolase family protein [Vibrio nitrifigilis]MBF9000581.1 fumarylacetoacetate hydrolase family protein [Vibrio nitrifigilis]
MKLATLQSHQRDGQLVVVSRDLSQYVAVPGIANTMQYALDHWLQVEPDLKEVYLGLCSGKRADAKPFNQALCHSPLPRAYHWADGSAYVNHVELVRKARGAQMPPSFWTDPLMYQGGSDTFLAPHAPIEVRTEQWGLDFEAEVAVITGDVPVGCSSKEAAHSIKLVMLVNDVSLRNLIPGELAKGFGFYQAKPSSSFSPVAVTLDELGPAWDGTKVVLPLLSTYNGHLFGRPNTGADMTFNFPQLIAHAAKTRSLVAGTIIGSGTVSNKQHLDMPTEVEKGGVGYSCIAERRMIEILKYGEATTQFMRHGDDIKIEMFNAQGESIFGAIEQTVHVVGAIP